jgi:hypothetical protein
MGARCTIGRDRDSTGTLNWDSDFEWLYGFLEAEYTDLDVDSVELTARHHCKIRLENCTAAGAWNLGIYNFTPPDYTGIFELTDTVFTGGPGATCLTLTGNGPSTAATITRCRFDKDASFQWPGGDTPGLLALGDCSFRRGLHGNWPAAFVDITGPFLYHRAAQATTGQYTLSAKYKKAYAFADYTDGAAGNPHFGSQNRTGTTLEFEESLFEYRGPAPPDTGDVLDLHSGSAILDRCIVLPSDVPGTSSGAVWWLGGVGTLELIHSTLHTPGNAAGVRFPHSTAMSAGRVKVRSCILWSDQEGGGQFGIFNDSPGASDVDALAPGDCVGNAFVGLTPGTNTVGGVSTPIVGIDGCEFSELPSGNLELPRGGASFVQSARGFIAWGRAVRGLAGTDDAVRDAAVAAIEADRTLVRLSLVPWVTAGYSPRAEELEDAGHDGVTIGAVASTPAAPTSRVLVITSPAGGMLMFSRP